MEKLVRTGVAIALLGAVFGLSAYVFFPVVRVDRPLETFNETVPGPVRTSWNWTVLEFNAFGTGIPAGVYALFVNSTGPIYLRIVLAESLCPEPGANLSAGMVLLYESRAATQASIAFRSESAEVLCFTSANPNPGTPQDVSAEWIGTNVTYTLQRGGFTIYDYRLWGAYAGIATLLLGLAVAAVGLLRASRSREL